MAVPQESSPHKKTLATLAATAAVLGGFAATVYVLTPHEAIDKPPVTETRHVPAAPDETPAPAVIPAPAAAPTAPSATPSQPTVTTSAAAPVAAAAEAPKVTPTTLRCVGTPSRPC